MKCHCNQASIATVTHHLPEPTSPYPRGSRERTGISEMTSEEEFPGEETEINEGRRTGESEKPEGDLRSKTAERETTGEPREPRDGETRERKATNEDRRRLETSEQQCVVMKSSREAPGKYAGSRHVPGGAWHSQQAVRRSYDDDGTYGGVKESGDGRLISPLTTSMVTGSFSRSWSSECTGS
ncbi:hypothetical protein NDU88_000194 [Pleurodeles waltl]|uniref:Uncharacterized protein n=1 Tax=Pleurodeles waltl TaxID=8319 RepID=A0AAV7V4F5_PLEWA|nr:hypothetical protein NDU88_000194 [Pleurodeles waltl]